MDHYLWLSMLPTIPFGDYISLIGDNDIYQIAVANILHPPERQATNCFHHYIELNALYYLPKYSIPFLCIMILEVKRPFFKLAMSLYPYHQ